MKKWFLGFVTISVVITLSFTLVLRFPPWQIGNAIKVATGLGAKLACSGRYVAGQTDSQISDDLASYSPVTHLLKFENDEKAKTVTASLFDMSASSATFRDGLGCTLNVNGFSPLNEVHLKPPQGPDPLNIQIDSTVQAAIENILHRDNEEGADSRAIVVLKQGSVIGEVYAAPYSSESPFLGWSMGKTVMSMLIGNLIQKNTLSPNDTQLFAQWRQDERSAISLDNLLTMTSGLAFDETYMPGSDSTQMLFAEASASSVPLTKHLDYEPGIHNRYSSGTTNLLARLVYERTGGSAQSQYEFLSETLIKPLNLDSLVFESDESGIIVGSSYIYAKGRDWAKLGQLILNKGRYQNTRVFSEAYALAMMSPNKSENEDRYGYQLWLNKGSDKLLRWPSLPEDAVAMRGNRAQWVLIIPSMDCVIVRLGWTSGHYDIEHKFAAVFASLKIQN